VRRSKIDGWYSRKAYSHFDHPLPFEKAEALASDASPFEKSVLGYRAGLGTNIHMAAKAFGEIRKRGECAAIAFVDRSQRFARQFKTRPQRQAAAG